MNSDTLDKSISFVNRQTWKTDFWMTNHHVLQLVRDSLANWLNSQHPGETFRPQESILIRDGFYCGRGFHFADYQAVWFAEEATIKIYSAAGELIQKLVVSDRSGYESVRRAA